MKRKTFLAGALAAAVLLPGCATLSSVTSDVSSYGEWPTGRAPGSYAFERLPSQAARAAEAAALEAAAKAALAKAGFAPVAEGSQPDVLVQVAARATRTDVNPWADPLWWRGGFGYWRYGPWVGPGWSLHARFDALRYEREVALLIRDRASGKPLFEARASNEGHSSAGAETVGAMFEAALADFPRVGINPRRVTVATR